MGCGGREANGERMSEPYEEVPRLRVGTEWLDLTVEADPYIVVTARGYAAALAVRDASGKSHELLAGAASIAQGIELLREENGGEYTGIRFKIRRESGDRFARYEIEG